MARTSGRSWMWAAMAGVAVGACGGDAFQSRDDGGASGASSGDVSTSGSAASGHGGSGAAESGNGASGNTGSGASSGSPSSGGADSGESSGATSGAASGASSGSGGGSGSAGGCPTSTPQDGTACSPIGLQCEYGKNPGNGCNTVVECDARGWTADGSGACPPSTCPASYAEITQGATCTASGSVCAYAQGTCNCSEGGGPYRINLDGGPDTTWDCFPATASCPSPRPDIGSSCSKEGTVCDYGACEGGIALACVKGTWQNQPTPCPLSLAN